MDIKKEITILYIENKTIAFYCANKNDMPP